MSNYLSHLNQAGEANMVDISDKSASFREASACATVVLGEVVFKKLIEGNNKKGDVLSVARIAGIQAAKKCSDLIPLCHPLALTSINVDFELVAKTASVQISTRCKLRGSTGVEMEALTAASVAALTIYDMCKALSKGIVISNIQLDEKLGGKSGHWQRSDD